MLPHSFCRAAACLTLCLGGLAPAADQPTTVAGLPLIDLNEAKNLQVLVDREKGQYLGHPTTLLLEDGKTILCVYPMGHGKGPILFKRSTDGGLTWSERLPTPKNWQTSKETPTLHRVVDAQGRLRFFRFAPRWVSADDGAPLLLAILQDVTLEHLAVDAATRSGHELDQWFDLSPIGMLVSTNRENAVH